MKISSMLAVLCLMFGAIGVQAGEGSTLLPHWSKTGTHSYVLFVTNIAESPITVHVELYDQDGNYYNESSESGDDITIKSAFVGDPTDGGGTLLPKQTGKVVLNTGSTARYGGGLVRWESTSDLRVAAVAYAYRHYSSTSGVGGQVAVEVNHSDPF